MEGAGMAYFCFVLLSFHMIIAIFNTFYLLNNASLHHVMLIYIIPILFFLTKHFFFNSSPIFSIKSRILRDVIYNHIPTHRLYIYTLLETKTRHHSLVRCITDYKHSGPSPNPSVDKNFLISKLVLCISYK